MNKSGTNNEVLKWIEAEQAKHRLCACGCGNEIKIIREHFWRGIPKYISGHNSKGTNHPLYGKHHSKETRRKISEHHADVSGKNHPMFGKHLSESRRKKISKSRIGKYTGKNSACYGKKFSEEHLRKLSVAHTGIPISEENKKRLSKIYSGSGNPMFGRSGKKAPGWKGGISFLPYCPKFNDAFKEEIREKFNRVCFLCPTTEKENGRKLNVHHIDYNKDCLCDDSECEFVPLCDSCHAKTNFDRDFWHKFILNKLKEEGYLS